MGYGFVGGIFSADDAGGGPISSSLYKGLWNASTNSPSLASGVGTEGDLYAVSQDGTTSLDGITSWTIGEFALFTGGVWTKFSHIDQWIPDTYGIMYPQNIGVGATSITLADSEVKVYAYNHYGYGAYHKYANIMVHDKNTGTYGTAQFELLSEKNGDATLHSVLSELNNAKYDLIYRTYDSRSVYNPKSLLGYDISTDVLALGSGSNANDVVLQVQPDGTVDLAVATTKYVDDNAADPTFYLPFYVDGVLATGDNQQTIICPVGATITNVYIKTVDAGNTGAALTVDVHKNGTTVFTTQSKRPSIADGGSEDTSDTPDVTAVSAEDILRVCIDSVGSTVAGSGLAGWIELEKT